MKLAKGVTVYVGSAKFVGEIPEKFAYLVAAPKKAEIKPKPTEVKPK